jgi:hypothetical protein
MKTITSILAVSLFSLISIIVAAQDFGNILSPRPNDTILNGQLFIVFKAEPELKVNPSKLNLTIDKLNYSTLIKFSSNKVTALVLRPLPQGEHEIVLKLFLGDGDFLEKKWTFYTYNENKMKRKYPEQWKKHDKGKKDFEIKGSVSLSAKVTELTGEGAYLRQEPPQSQYLRTQGTVRYKKLQIPFKFYYTNHENPLLPPRNRFRLGIKGEKAGLIFGDVNPSYDKLIQNGSRIRGGEIFIKFRNTKINFTHGEINRRSEGQLEYWDINQGFQPVYILPDSSYVIPGTYTRYLSAFNFESNPKNSKNRIGLTFIRSTDDVASIQFGGPAKQNVALSFNTVVAGRDNRYYFDMGVAISATTKDIRRGAVNPEEFQSTYKKELRVNPSMWENFFIVNSTTVPLTTKNAPFVAWYINGRFNILKQRVSLNLRRLGASFESFGNPYLQNDRRELMFRDNIGFWKSNINLNLQYRYLKDNLSKVKSISNITEMAGANLSVKFGTKFPRLIAAYRLYIRKSKLLKNDELARKNIVSNYSAGINHNFKTGEYSHTFSVVYNRNIRESQNVNMSGNTNDNINLNISERMPFGLGISFNYNHLLLANDTTDLSDQQTLGFRISYITKNGRFRLSAGGRQIYAMESTVFSESVRQIVDILISYKVIKNAFIKLQVGNSIYNEPESTGRNYNENWGQVGLRYSL